MSQSKPSTHRSSRHAACAFAALASVALVRLSMPPFDCAVLAPVSWVPLLVLVGRVSGRTLVGLAGFHGLVLNLTAQWWVVPALRRTAEAPWWAAVGALVLVATLQAARIPLVVLLVHCARRYRCPLWLSFPLGMALAETVYPELFPWTLALQVHSAPVWLQAASLGGASAVTLWLAVVNALLAESVVAIRGHNLAWRPLVAAGGVLGAATLFGHSAMQEQTERELDAPAAQVAVGHVESPADGSEREPVPELRAGTLAAERRAPDVELAVWPEVAVARPVDAARLPHLARDFVLRDRARGARGLVLQVPVLLGASVRDSGLLNNSAVLVGSPGLVLGRYDKRALMPLGDSRPPDLPPVGNVRLRGATGGTGTGAREGKACLWGWLDLEVKVEI